MHCPTILKGALPANETRESIDANFYTFSRSTCCFLLLPFETNGRRNAFLCIVACFWRWHDIHSDRLVSMPLQYDTGSDQCHSWIFVSYRSNAPRQILVFRVTAAHGIRAYIPYRTNNSNDWFCRHRFLLEGNRLQEWSTVASMVNKKCSPVFLLQFCPFSHHNIGWFS